MSDIKFLSSVARVSLPVMRFSLALAATWLWRSSPQSCQGRYAHTCPSGRCQGNDQAVNDLSLFIEAVLKSNFLLLIVFLSGVAVMGIEMAASRLLRPFFGDSILIWANIIGLILIYLTIGYYLGGRWADRDPRAVTLYRIIAWAGFATGILPFVARPFLQMAIPALQHFDAGLGFVSFVGKT